MKKPVALFFLPLFFFLVLTSFPDLASAVFDMTVTQVEGGFDLRFNKINPTDFKLAREMTVRVNSDIGKGYRVFEQLSQPLATGDGQLLDPGQFQMYARAGSNARGTLIYGQEEPVTTDQRLLYTSDTVGTADSFQMVYTVTPKKDQLPGSYRGRLSLVLVPVDTTEQQVVVNVQVFVELGTGASAVVDIATNSGSDRLTLNSKDMQLTKSGSVEDTGTWPQIHLKVYGPLGHSYKIYHSLETGDLTSSEGYVFDSDTVQVVVSEGSHGIAAPLSTLKGARQRQLLYSSDPHGASDEIVITYQPTALFRLIRTGIYRGRLTLFLETEEMTNEPAAKKTFDLEFNVAALFDIRVYSNEVEGVSLQFGEVGYKKGPSISQTQIFVESNLGKPYKVVQRVSSPMVNDRGEKVPAEDFTMKVASMKVQEEPASYVRDFQPVLPGENVIFSSGSAGLSAEMNIDYRLVMKPDSPAGNYNTRIGYSLVLD